MPIPTTCPECNADLNVPDKFAGKTVKCLECAAHVEVPGVVEAARATQRNRPQHEDEDEEKPRPEKRSARTNEDEVRPRRRRKEKSGGPSTGIVIGLVVGAIALVGIAVGFFLLVKDSTKERRSDSAAGNTTEQGSFPLFPDVSDSRSTRPPLPAGWIEFKHPRGLYRVYVPCTPSAGTLTASGRIVDTEDIYEAWQIQGRGTQCHMRVSTLPPQELQGYRSGERQASNVYTGKTRATARITWGGQPATEVEVGGSGDTGWGDQDDVTPPRPGPQTQTLLYYMRWAVVNDRLYTFAIANSKDKVTDVERKAFFDSVVFGK